MPTLDWLNQTDAKRTTQKVPYCLLEAVPELCAGKVKCIYIDPPYNTRSAFEHYDDNLEAFL
jgi:adenine-specific DNA-methyltransferase